MYENTRHLSDEPVKFSIFVLIKFFEKYKKKQPNKTNLLLLLFNNYICIKTTIIKLKNCNTFKKKSK